MSFGNLNALWLGLLLPILVLLYMLKLKRDERLVSSTYLWRRMVRDIQANAPWQRLQRNLLLFLQLLFLTTLILTIARPGREIEGIDSRTVVLILDTSASMAATDLPPNRLEAAKQEAYRIVDSLASEARVTLITAGEKPRTLVSLSTDRRLIRQAISQVEAGSGGSDLATALQIAGAIATRQLDAQTIVLSDGNVQLPDRQTIPGRFRFISIGEKQENQAIELISLQTNPADHAIQAFVLVANHSSQPVKRRVAFYSDGAATSVSDIEIAAFGEQSVLANGILSTTQVVEVQLLPDEATSDYLELDDRAFAVTRPAEPTRVTVVGTGNLFLETALSLIPAIELRLVGPEDAVVEPTDLVIYDGVIPAVGTLPDANLLFIAPLESTEFFSVTGQIEMPISVPVAPIDPLVENIDFSNVNILDSAEISLPAWAKPLIVDFSERDPQAPTPLLFAGEKEGRRVAVLAFSLSRSDLPLQIAFPILFSNLTNWLAPGSAGQIPVSVTPGAPVRLTSLVSAPGSADGELIVTRPDGSSVRIVSQENEFVFADTSQLGVYKVNPSRENPVYFAVNLFSPDESRIAPAETLGIVGVTAQNGDASDQRATQEWWRWLAAFSLLILVLEWLVFHRATIARLAGSLKAWRANTKAVQR